MFTDARSLDEDSTIESDVCIIGAGAAGITIARELIDRRLSICLLESGGFDYHPETQALHEGRSTGRRYNPLHTSRLRYFGGTTNHWTGLCSPLDPIDFAHRPWIPHSGWPIARSELDPFYERAQRVCELGPYRYDDVAFWEADDKVRLPLSADKVVTKIFQYSTPTRFGQVYREELSKAQNVRVLLYANALDLETDENASHVRRVRAGCLNGRRFWVQARYYVLACGGIENPRLLLLSTGTAPRGLGNDHDLVGRFFMDHPHVPSAKLLLSTAARAPALYRAFERAGSTAVGYLRLADGLQRERRLLNYSAALTPLPAGGYASMRRLYYRFRAGDAASASLMQDIENVIADFEDVVLQLNNSLLGRTGSRRRAEEPTRLFWLDTRVEPAPNPSSRLTLGLTKDALGLRRVQLEWRLSSIDKHTIREATGIIGRESGRTGIGRLQLLDWLSDDDDAWSPDMYGGNHHAGTTRMGETPEEGVVDSDCKVYGTNNLYIAGSSVFPTVGCANPTLTIVALALRLADHVASRLEA
jgi:choline dehydrogenase-like flavoprotein